MIANATILQELQQKLGEASIAPQAVRDQVPTFWTSREKVHEVVQYLKNEVAKPYRMLYDITATDDRVRQHREGMPASDFTVIYHLLSFERNEYIRIKVPLKEDSLSLPTITDVWPAANWYEREVWDMFGIKFDGHPFLARILMPKTWVGHPLRKDHPARATEMGPFSQSQEKVDAEQ